MAKSGSLFFSNLTFTNKQKMKMIKSLEHSLRIEHFDSDITYDRNSHIDNFIEIDNKIINTNILSQEEKIEILKSIIPDYEYGKTDYAVIDNFVKLSKNEISERSKSLKYLKNIKTDSINEKLFVKLLEDFSNKDNNFDYSKLQKLEEVFKSCDFYQKPILKNFKKFTDLVRKGGLAKKPDRIEFCETIIKIPHHNQITNISATDLRKYGTDFFKREFPEYKIEIAFEHNDELMKEKLKKNQDKDYKRGYTGQHVHIMTNTQNSITKDFDFYEKQFDFCYKYLKESKNFKDEAIFEYIGKRQKGIRTKTQLSNMGIVFQNAVYEDINLKLFAKKDYSAEIGFIKRDSFEKMLLQEDAAKKISQRQFQLLKLREQQQEEELILIKEMKEETIALTDIAETIVDTIENSVKEDKEFENFKKFKEEISKEKTPISIFPRNSKEDIIEILNKNNNRMSKFNVNEVYKQIEKIIIKKYNSLLNNQNLSHKNNTSTQEENKKITITNKELKEKIELFEDFIKEDNIEDLFEDFKNGKTQITKLDRRLTDFFESQDMTKTDYEDLKTESKNRRKEDIKFDSLEEEIKKDSIEEKPTPTPASTEEKNIDKTTKTPTEQTKKRKGRR